MKRKAVIFSEWKGEQEFHSQKQMIVGSLKSISDFQFISFVKKPKAIETLPKIEQLHYLSRKDLTIFGKLKKEKVKTLLKEEHDKVFIVSQLENSSFLKRLLKNISFLTVGVQNENLPNFDVSFKNVVRIDKDFFEKIDKYLIKIKS